MVNAVILLMVEKSKVNEVAGKLVELPGISEVYSVAGHYDLVAIARVRQNEDIAEAVRHPAEPVGIVARRGDGGQLDEEIEGPPEDRLGQVVRGFGHSGHKPTPLM